MQLKLKTARMNSFIDAYERKAANNDSLRFARRVQFNSVGNFGTQSDSYTGCAFARPRLRGCFVIRPFVKRSWNLTASEDEKALKPFDLQLWRMLQTL